MKPQRPSPEIKTTYKCKPTTYIYNIHREHSQTFIQHTIMQEKLLFVLNMENACIYKVFLSTACNKVSALLFYSLLTDFSHTLQLSKLSLLLTKNEIQNLFYLRGLFKLFPPTYLPYSIALNGMSSPTSGSRS
jgi:hypothetical protein